MKVLLFVFLIILSSHSQDIDSLLQSYQKESDLSKKTKDESAGNLIVYTRDDLERMQVESLKDILKSLRFFAYAENRLGQSDILNADPISYYSKSIRVYLNENELLTSIVGSGLVTFGDMEMDFIDHVEIYEGFPSFDFGVEPATIVIRLYTKSPEHDEGGRVKAFLGSYGTNKENVYYTNKEDDLSYFIYANHTDSKKDTYFEEAETLRRDKITNRFYSSLSNEQHKFEFHLMQEEGDAFLGSLVGNIPDATTIESMFLNATLNSKFMNDTLSVNLSYIKGMNKFAYEYDATTPGIIPSDVYPYFTSIESFYQNIEEEAFTASIKKVFSLDIHDISIGLQYRHKNFDLTDVRIDAYVTPTSQEYYRENIYSFFLQDLISLNNNHMLSLSLMHQVYKRDGDVDTPHTAQLRFGYIYTNDTWVAKTFISSQEFASEPYMTISPHYGNPTLAPEVYESIFQEFSYGSKSTLSKLILGYGKNKNMPIIDTNFQVQNSKFDTTGISTALEFTLFFNENDKLEFQTNYTNVESPYTGISTKHFNSMLRMLNTVAKFDIFNEIVIHDGYDDVSTGYDYSCGVKYAYSKDININLKGENIFNSGLDKRYMTQFQPEPNYILVPRIERRFLFGLEYLF